MNNPLLRLVMIGLLLLTVIAPFAGLAPLMLVLLVIGVGYGLISLFQTLLFGESKREPDSNG